MKPPFDTKENAFQRAKIFMVRYLEKEVTKGDKIVSFRTLAKRSGVSVFTIAKVITSFIDEGILTKVSNEGIYKGTPPQNSAALPKDEIKHYSRKWERVKARIIHDILTGKYDNKIINTSEMITRYGVTFSTIKKALDSLTTEGLIIESKSGFQVLDISRSQHTATITMISAGTRDGIPWYSSEMEFEISRTVETECLRSGINLKLVIFDGSVSDTMWAINYIQQKHTVIGTILLGFHIDKFSSLLSHILKLGLPTAAITLDDQQLFSSDIQSTTRLGAFILENRLQPGRKAGRYLIQSGHKKVIYLDAHPNETWSQRRLQGLHEIFTGVSERCSVIHIPLKNVTSLANDYFQNTMQLQQIFLSAEKYRILKNNITRFFRRYSLLQQILDQIEHHQTITDQKEITAWVGDTDTTALAILDHLRYLHIQIPERIAVLGFNNSTEAQTFNLTSFDFNAISAARGMVKFIINPSAFPQWPQKIFIEGTIIKRATT